MVSQGYEENDGLFTLIGNTALQAVLHHCAVARKPGFFLLTGPDHIGKQSLAVKLTKAYHCESKTYNPACLCAGCDRLKRGLHPDHYTFEESGNITVEHVRKLHAFTALQSAYGHIKTIVLTNAERLTVEAQNALLKLLEDHHEKTVVVFTSSQTAHLLTTVRSRARVFEMKRVASSTLTRALQNRYPTIPSSLREQMVSDAYGLPGLAIAWCQEPESYRELQQRRARVSDALQTAEKGLRYSQQMFRGKTFQEQRALLYNIVEDAVALLQKDIERACDAQNISRFSQHLRRYTLLTPLLRNRQQMLNPQLLMDHMIITQHL